MDETLKELRSIDKAIESNLDTVGMVAGFKEVSDSYFRALRDIELHTLKLYRVV